MKWFAAATGGLGITLLIAAGETWGDGAKPWVFLALSVFLLIASGLTWLFVYFNNQESQRADGGELIGSSYLAAQILRQPTIDEIRELQALHHKGLDFLNRFCSGFFDFEASKELEQKVKPEMNQWVWSVRNQVRLVASEHYYFEPLDALWQADAQDNHTNYCIRIRVDTEALGQTLRELKR